MMVSDIISRDVEVVSPETTVTHIAMAMKDRNCGSIPVVEHDRLVGMVTDRDIVVRCIAAGVDPDITTARDIMSPGIKYCYSDQPVEEVARNMGDIKVRRLPVVNREKKLVGIVSLGDLAIVCEDDSVCGEVLEHIRLA